MLKYFFLLATLFLYYIYADPVAGPFYGDGTYYTSQGIFNGHCSYDLTDSLKLPFITNVDVTAAMNKQQYANGSACGMCLVFRGLDRGCTTCGSTPFSTQWKTAIITDECPKCKYGDIDFAMNGDGRWKIEWYQVECVVGKSNLHYGLKVSNKHYMKIQVSNSIYPIVAVNVTTNNQNMIMQMTMDNFFVGQSYSGEFDFPMPISIEDSQRQIVKDSVNLPGYGNSSGTGNVQFKSLGRDTVKSFSDLLTGTTINTPQPPAQLDTSSSPESGPAGENYFND